MPRKRLTIDLTGLYEPIDSARPNDSAWEELSFSAKCRVLINLGLKALDTPTEQTENTEDTDHAE